MRGQRLRGLARLPPRYLPAYLRSLLPGHSALSEGLPWMTFGAIAALEAFLRPGMAVFEWGAGGSTVFFASRGGRTISIEHDPVYQTLVEGALRARSLSAELILVPAPLRSTPAPAYGLSSDSSASRGFEALDFGAYVRAIDPHPDQAFDLVVIDGRARASCLRRALPKVRPGGCLVLDDAASPVYAEALDHADRWASTRRDYDGWMPANVFARRLYTGRTTIWRAP